MLGLRLQGSVPPMNADIFDLVRESVVLCNRDGRITRWNAASEQIYGWSRGDALGNPVNELLKTRRETASLIEHALREAGRWEGEVQRRAANGVLKTIRLKCVLHSPDEVIEA